MLCCLVGCSALTSFNCFKCNKTENFRESFVNSPVWCGLSHHNSRPAVRVRGRVVCLTPQFTDKKRAQGWYVKIAVEGRIKCDFVREVWARPGRAEQSGETNYLYRRPAASSGVIIANTGWIQIRHNQAAVSTLVAGEGLVMWSTWWTWLANAIS